MSQDNTIKLMGQMFAQMGFRPEWRVVCLYCGKVFDMGEPPVNKQKSRETIEHRNECREEMRQNEN